MLFARLWDGFGLLFEYLALLGGIILLGVLPWALLTTYLLPQGHDERPEGWAWLIGISVGFATRTLARGALAYALAHIQHDREVGFSEAVGVALRFWWRLLVARLQAWLLIFGGLVMGLLPGVVLLVRYAFIAEAVVLENAGARQARRRSWALSRGKSLPILGIYLLAEGLGFLLTAPFTVLHFASGVTVALTSVLLVCVSSVLSGIGPIAFFLLYWQTRAEELGHPPAAPVKEVRR